MVLYFNSKITNKTVFSNTSISLTTYSEIPFPKESILEYADKLEVLKKTLISYSKLNFIACVFNIEIDDSEESFKEIKELIINNFNYKDLLINKRRPSNLKDWKKDLEGIRERFGDEMPIFLCQNHDHPFVDYQSSSFEKVVNSVFPKVENNFSKCLIYSHSPDFTSVSYDAQKGGAFQFIKEEKQIFRTKRVDTYFDSIVILTLETIFHILNQLKFNGDYLGRFDWPGVQYNNLRLRYYFFPREFFRHFDGYYISTGMRCFEDLNESKHLPFQFPGAGDTNEKIDFYYQRWIDNFMIYLRDEMLKKPSKTAIYKTYKNALISSLSFFDKTYLKEDLKYSLITEEEYEILKIGLENKVYFNFNSIFNTLNTELVLYNRGYRYQLKRFYNNNLKYHWLIITMKFLIPKKIFIKIRNLFDKI